MEITAQSASVIDKMNWIQKWLPERGRRIIAIVSLYGYLCRHYKRRPAMLGKLQRDLNLARNKNAVYFPIFMGKFVWPEASSPEVPLHELKVNDLMRMMRQCSVHWLRYEATRTERVLQLDMAALLDAVQKSPATDIIKR